MMISYENSVKITFDEEGGCKISNAIHVIESIVDALQKADGGTSTMEEELKTAASYLRAILDGVHW